MKKLKAIRKLKYYMFKYGIARVLPGRLLIFLGNLSGLSKWIHGQKVMGFSDFPSKTFNYSKRRELFQFVLDHEINNQPIDYLEFGVSRGTSFKWWTEHVNHRDARFYGFDTFTGLPEDWGPFKKGSMSTGNKPPLIDDDRHTFYQGLFQDTLPGFLRNYQSDRKKVVHLDADLYSSTLFVLISLYPFLGNGDILMFDEFNVPMHEYRAFRDWVDATYTEYQVIGECNNYYQVAIKLI